MKFNPPHYHKDKGYKKSVFDFLKFHFSALKAMWPYIREFGWRYWYDYEFRQKMKSKRIRRKQKEKYGSGYLSSRRQIRQRLVKRDGKFCRICHVKEGNTIDHVTCLRDGGTHDLSNLQLLCLSCHRLKDQKVILPKNGMPNFEFSFALQEFYEKEIR